MPQPKPTSRAKNVSSIVAGKALQMISDASAPLVEMPKSPTTTPPIQLKYCSYQGSLSPSCSR